MGGESLVRFVHNDVFVFDAEIAARADADMVNARLVIDEPTVPTRVLDHVDALGFHRADADTNGDPFEHVPHRSSRLSSSDGSAPRATHSAPSSA